MPSNWVTTTIETFEFTGSVQTWSIPTGVNTIEATVIGAKGGGSDGDGGRVRALIDVSSISSLEILVGEKGSRPSGGWPAGGDGAEQTASGHDTIISGGGGGRSEIRQTNGTRLLVAGGGGGGGDANVGFLTEDDVEDRTRGGHGGANNGETAPDTINFENIGIQHGGVGGDQTDNPGGEDGTSSKEVNFNDEPATSASGGGGDGYDGGGAGDEDAYSTNAKREAGGAGGGGGSNYVGGASDVFVNERNYNDDVGKVIIEYIE